MKEKITLTSYMRTLLLEEICKRMNIIDYCRYLLDIILEQRLRDTFTGDCPFCNGSRAFIINKRTGKYSCGVCKEKGDFLILMGKKRDRDLTGTLQILTGYLEAAEKRGGHPEGIATQEGGVA